jgi:DNA polymerase bacteriophage-type
VSLLRTKRGAAKAAPLPLETWEEITAGVRASDPDDGPTFPIERVGFIDFETRGRTDIKAGAYRYATEADAIILTYAIGRGPVREVSVRDFSRPLDMVDLPTEFLAFHAKVMTGGGMWAAWNAGFDRAVWNFATLGFPELKPRHIIDVMAQAVASGLPPDLKTASGKAGDQRKDRRGAVLIRLFCLPDSTATPVSHPVEWQEFREYALQDIEALRSLFLSTRQLPLAEWREYWAMEAINDRGAAIDLGLVRAAAKLAEQDKVRSTAELRAITGDPAMTVDMVRRLTAWLLERLPSEGRAILTKREEEVDEDGALVKPAKHALTRRQVERLIAYVNDLEMPGLECVLRVLQIRLYGGSKTPAKFTKMLTSHVDGVLYGQYVFNGASQTGRASSRGVQVHNLARDTLPNEPDTIDGIIQGINYEGLLAFSPDPVSRQLSLLIRPAFIPSGDNVFVWSDWSQIEARVLPWLCDHMPGARERLQVFRDVDADPTLPDLYTRTAAVLSHVLIEQVTKPMRQRGKVAELALGFCGGVGALQAMAAGYGMHLSDDDARKTVDDWRAANPWSRDFSRELWEAVRAAEHAPGVRIRVGRVFFVFVPGYLDGTLLCCLPSGRYLTYRRMRWEDIDVLDDDKQPTGEKKHELMFHRGYGKMKLWPGMFVENITQAVAADVLRGTLVRLERLGAKVRLHTHDEVLLECAREEADNIAVGLRELMRQGFDWSEGLPLMSEETIAYYYTKHEGSHGL